MSVELREMLYLDVERVRALAGQLWPNGIPESLEIKRGSEKSGKATIKLLEGAYAGVVEDVERRALAESLFPLVESELEAESFLVDASEWASSAENWSDQALGGWAQPGYLVRLTSAGSLVDSRQFTHLVSSFGATMSGMAKMGLLNEEVGNKGPQPPRMEDAKVFRPETGLPEDAIAPMPQSVDFNPKMVRGMVQLARGMFPPGVNLRLNPLPDDSPSVWCRLQEGREFLDAEPEVLFARYGFQPQIWTVVGIVGAVASPPQGDFQPNDFMDGERINRGRASDLFNQFSDSFREQGLTGGPQYPGFSLVPIAVYREIRRATAELEEPAEP